MSAMMQFDEHVEHVEGEDSPSTPRFSRLLTSVLGSPFLTTSDLPAEAMLALRMDIDELETVDGTFNTVPRAQTITRPSSPTPSFSTDTYSFVNWTEHSDMFTPQHRPSVSDAAPACSFLPGSIRRSTTYYTGPASSPYNTLRCPQSGSLKRSRSFSLLPRLWDVLRESSPGKKGKRRMDLANAYWGDLEIDGYIDYTNLPPLDGEEGELIDDEACFIDVRAVTGLDIVAQIPHEVALHLFAFLELPDILSCLCVSKTWHQLASDNSVWRSLFGRKRSTGWEIDFRRSNTSTLTPAARFASAHRTPKPFSRSIPAPLEFDWYEMYKTRAELDRRWNAKSYLCNGSEDKENANIWEPRARRLSGHTDSVYCLEFDSSRIITGSRDRTIKVWSVKTGRCLATITGHRGSVLCLKFDQDFDLDEANSLTEDGLQGWRKGFMVSGSSDTSVCVWDLYAHPSEGEDGEEMAIMAEMRGVLRGHTGGVLDLRISDKWIISCSKDTLIRVWNRSTLALHCTLKGHEGPVNAVGLQGNRVVSASGDGNMILWDITKGERLRTFEGHDRGLACIDFKDDYIVSGSNDCKIKVWCASTGECLRTLLGHDMLVRALSFDPRSGRLVSGSYDRTVKVWDMHTGKMIREFKTCHASHIFDVKFDCNRIVSTSHDQKIVVLHFADGLDTSLFA